MVISEAAMEHRKALAERIRARMAKPATAAEEELWLELKKEIRERRAPRGSVDA
jgi:hypothetical protein